MDAEKQTLSYVLNNDQQKLVEENWEFAIKVARCYAGVVPMADLESEAWIALCDAAYKYKKVDGCKFSSYAYHFIRGAIMKLLKSESERRSTMVGSVDDDLAEGNLDDCDEWQADEKRYEMLAELMAMLTVKEQEVVRRCYGLECEPVTMNELAKELGLSYERIRALHAKAVNKLMIMNKQKLSF